jgi:hypothetical protein
MSFNDFPKAMSHPQYRPAVISRDTVGPDGKTVKAPPGQPAKFPPVYVNNADQEAQYASLGYVPNGVSDPEAYRRAIAGADLPPSHEHQEYPRWVYQAHEDGDMHVEVDGEYVAVRSHLVNDEPAHAKLKGEWHITPLAAATAEATEEEGQDGQPAAEKRGPGRPRKAEVA